MEIHFQLLIIFKLVCVRKSANILFYLLIAYIVVAGGWWSYLLHSKNREARALALQKITLQLEKEGIEEVQAHANYKKAENHYQRQHWMIIGEGSVFMLLLLLGVWRIYLIRKKEIALALQQQNFLLSITHELKSPIASVQLILETFQKRQLTAEQIQKLSKNGLTENDRLHKLVQDLLLAARVEGGYQYNFEPVDMIGLVEECIGWAQPKYAGRIEFELPEKDITLRKADYNTLSSAIFNLLENAIKYAPNTDTIELKLYTKRDFCMLEIKDFGIGIPKVERYKIFDKFYRVGNELIRKTKGTGLGLYIVKKVIDAHQGNISIRDNLPHGSIFVLQLPL